MPSLQSNVSSSFTSEAYQKRINNNLLIKNNESIRAYRIRLRALLDSQFSVNITKDKVKSPVNATNLIQFKINQIKTRKKINLLKPIEEKAKDKMKKTYKPCKDPYFCVNILQRTGFTSFLALLNIFNEPVANYPYCFRIARDVGSLEVRLEDSVKNVQKSDQVLKCPGVELKRIKAVREEFRWTKRVWINVQKVDCMTKALIINLDCIYQSNQFLPSALEALQLLEGHLHLILVIPPTLEVPPLLDKCKSLSICFSAIYIFTQSKNPYTLLDYSSIYLDFHCFEPSEDCIIFSVHNYEDLSEAAQGQLVGMQIGSLIKLFVENIPIISHEFSKQPITVMMYRPEIDDSCEGLLNFADIFLAYLRFNFSLRNNFDVKKVLRDAAWEVIESNLPFKAGLSYRKMAEVYRDLARSRDEGKWFANNLFLY